MKTNNKNEARVINANENGTREEVEVLNECLTAYHHTTAARVAHICQTIAESVGVCYGSTLPAFDMAISLQQFGEWQTATTPDDEMNPAAPFFFAVRKQGTESGTREHCKERCRILGAPVYVIKVEREEAAGLFTLKVRVSSPATREHVTHTAELAKTIGNEAAPRLAQFETLKEKHPAALLIFREDCPASYVLYNEDADTAAEVLGLTVNTAEGFRFASFPADRLSDYLPRIIRSGHRCAICERIEEKKPGRITEKYEAAPADTEQAEKAKQNRTARTIATIKQKAAALATAAALLLSRVLFIAAGAASGLAAMFAAACLLPHITPAGFVACLLLRVPALFAFVGLWASAYIWALNNLLPARVLGYIMHGNK